MEPSSDAPASKCPICGTSVSPDQPAFSWQGRVPGSALWQKLQVHVQTYHPDYFALNLKLFFAGMLLLLGAIFTEAVVSPFGLSPFQVLPFAVAILPGLLLYRWYRKRVSTIKTKWVPGQESEASPPMDFWKTPRYRWPMNKCHICGEMVPIRLGLQKDLEEHRRNMHPDYYRWNKRARLVLPPIVVLVGAMAVGFLIDQRTPFDIGVVGMLVLLVLVIVAGVWGERKYGRLTLHPPKPSQPRDEKV